MRHSHPNVQLGVDARRDGALYIAARVVQQHFVVSNVDADWRQTGQISVERRGQGILRIGYTQIGPDEPSRLEFGEVQICLRSRVEALACKREVSYRREYDGALRGHGASGGLCGCD